MQLLSDTMEKHRNKTRADSDPLEVNANAPATESAQVTPQAVMARLVMAEFFSGIEK